MKRAPFVLPFLAVLLAGCAATSSEKASAGGGKGAAHEVEDLERRLEVARARLEKARLEEEAFQAEHETRLHHAKLEHELAEARLALFREADAPNRLASEELDLRAARDRAQEAAEELEQIEIMYDEQDLDDLTAEFVVSRGRRNAERAAARIAILEAELRALEERELPQEEERLELEVEKAAAAVREATMKGEIEGLAKSVAVLEAEGEVAKLERELAEKRGEAQP